METHGNVLVCSGERTPGRCAFDSDCPRLDRLLATERLLACPALACRCLLRTQKGVERWPLRGKRRERSRARSGAEHGAERAGQGQGLSAGGGTASPCSHPERACRAGPQCTWAPRRRSAAAMRAKGRLGRPTSSPTLSPTGTARGSCLGRVGYSGRASRRKALAKSTR